jgi:hypothetical protein
MSGQGGEMRIRTVLSIGALFLVPALATAAPPPIRGDFAIYMTGHAFVGSSLLPLASVGSFSVDQQGKLTGHWTTFAQGTGLSTSTFECVVGAPSDGGTGRMDCSVTDDLRPPRSASYAYAIADNGREVMLLLVTSPDGTLFSGIAKQQ